VHLTKNGHSNGAVTTNGAAQPGVTLEPNPPEPSVQPGSFGPTGSSGPSYGGAPTT
jgi:hypothetical protein